MQRVKAATQLPVILQPLLLMLKQKPACIQHKSNLAEKVTGSEVRDIGHVDNLRTASGGHTLPNPMPVQAEERAAKKQLKQLLSTKFTSLASTGTKALVSKKI